MNYSNKNLRIRYLEIVIIEITKKSGYELSSIFNEICNISRIYQRTFKTRDLDSDVLSVCFMCPSCWTMQTELYSLLCGHILCVNCYGCKIKCVVCSQVISKSNIKSNVILNTGAKHLLSFFSKFFEGLNQVNKFIANNQHSMALISLTNLFKYEFCIHHLLLERSKIYAILNQNDSALIDLFDLINVARNWKIAHYQRGLILQISGDMLGATEAFLNAFILDPEDQEVSNKLFSVLQNLLTPSYFQFLETQSNEIKENILYSLDTHEKMVNFIHESLKKQYAYDKKMLLLNNKNKLTLKTAHSADFISKLSNRNWSFCDSVIKPKKHATQQLFIEYIKTKESFDCPLCLRVYLNPVSVTCGHTFCRHCIQRSLDYTPFCPLCKYDLTHYLKLKEIRVADNIQKIMKHFLWLEVAKYQFDYTKVLKSFIPSNGRCGFMICTVALPSIPCNLYIFEPKYRLLLRRAIESKSFQIGMVLSDQSTSHSQNLIGSILDIKSYEQMENGCFNVCTIAENRRVRLKNAVEVDGYVTADIEIFHDCMLDQQKLSILTSKLVALYKKTQEWLEALPRSLKLSIYSHYGELPLCEMWSNISKTYHQSNTSATNNTSLTMRPRPLYSSPKSSRKRRFPLCRSSNSDISKRLNSLNSSFPSLYSNNSFNISRYNPLHFIQPFDWIWWLIAILPLDDQTRYNLFSSDNPLYRVDWLNNILNIVGDNVNDYYSGENNNGTTTETNDADSPIVDSSILVSATSAGTGAVDSTTNISHVLNAITPANSTGSLPNGATSHLVSDNDTEHNI